MVYGILRGCDGIILDCIHRGYPFVHIDHGYFGRGWPNGYFRVTVNALQQSRPLAVDGTRFHWKTEHWKDSGDFIMLRPPTKPQADFFGVNPHRWVRDRKREIRRHFDMPVRVSQKGDHVDWESLYAVVSFNSLIAVGAVMRGKYASMSHGCVDRAIEELGQPWDRESWCNTLSWSQWTIEEMKSGECWEHISQYV